jgi:hypothetical protein
MSSSKPPDEDMGPSKPPTDITKHKVYALAILLATIIAAIAQVLVVPPTFVPWWTTKSSNKESIGKDQSQAEPSPSTPPTVPPPVAESSPPITPSVTPQDICCVWFSETSRKKYNFVCKGQNSFDIYEVRDQLLTITGSGKIVDDGSIKADILSMAKNRTAHLTLRLSSDRRKIEGSWHGDDPRESGRVVFHKIQEGYRATVL